MGGMALDKREVISMGMLTVMITGMSKKLGEIRDTVIDMALAQEMEKGK